jgi:CTP:molybdopterin cytidylyltransferase MocA
LAPSGEAEFGEPLGQPAGVAGLILAAGGSRRFGRPKLLAPLRGRPLISYALNVAGRARATGLLSDLRVVVAAGDHSVEALARDVGAVPVVNPSPERGLSGSLRLGLAALEADAALVLLADQPLVSLDVVAVLVAAWHERLGVLIRPRYAQSPDEPGHPVLVARSLWPSTDQLEGDVGVGRLLPAGADGVALIDVPGSNPDVDTPADLHLLEGPTA